MLSLGVRCAQLHSLTPTLSAVTILCGAEPEPGGAKTNQNSMTHLSPWAKLSCELELGSTLPLKERRARQACYYGPWQSCLRLSGGVT